MKKQMLSLALFLFMAPSAFAQNGQVKGQVLDEYGEPVVGAVIRVPGSKIATVTDDNGNYTLSGVPAGASLTYSYIGMKTQTLKVSGNVINVALEEDTQNLEEAVVIGYGSAKAKDLTAPITSVKSDAIQNVPSSSPMAALQGKVAGVNIVNSGTPGDGPSVTIRGLGSFGNTTPLYVVDGMFYDDINFLNNADIEEMTILKDASASAIYGVRAANGVIIITTKKGKQGERAKVTYDGYVGVQKATNLLEMCNSSEYAQMLRESGVDAYNDMLKASIAQYGGNFEQNLYNADTNWYDELLRPAMMTNHSLNISGGTDRATYGVGMSYLNQEGIMNTDNNYSRLNFRGNLEYKAFQWLTVGMNTVISNRDQKRPNNLAWQHAFNMPGIFPVYDPKTADLYTDGYASPATIGVSNNFYNPVATANLNDNHNKHFQALANFYAQINFIPEKLYFRTSASFDQRLHKNVTFLPTYYLGNNLQRVNTQLDKSRNDYSNWVWDNTLNYTEQWGKHRFTGMLGTSMRQERWDYMAGSAQNVPQGQESWKYFTLGDKEGITLADGGSRNRALSFFGRFNYNYADKYLVMVTLREDGSSKYNEKWGFFPSVGGAWVLSEEDFMKNQNVFQYMKLRASWGMLGNDKIGASAGYASVSPDRYPMGINTALDGYINGSNFSWLSWEVVNETNVGLNFTTAKHRLTADIDWYYRLTQDAVISPQRPMQNTTVAGNWAEILNTGLDISLNWNDQIGDDFKYQIGANFGWLHNEVKSLKDGITMIQGGKTVQMVGEKMNSFYGYKVTGIYQNQAQIDADPIGKANGCQPGDFIYEDTNGDGVLDGLDKQVLGSYVPDFTYGFNLGFQWKGLDFGMSFYGQAGGELWNRKRALRYAAQNYNFDRAQFTNRWTGDGSTNTDPSAAALMRSWNVGDSQNASYFVESASFFRIQNITLGYSFKNLQMGSYTMPGLRVYATADRPATFFKAHSFTPELHDAEGWDTEVYPLTATFTFGLQLNF